MAALDLYWKSHSTCMYYVCRSPNYVCRSPISCDVHKHGRVAVTLPDLLLRSSSEEIRKTAGSRLNKSMNRNRIESLRSTM